MLLRVPGTRARGDAALGKRSASTQFESSAPSAESPLSAGCIGVLSTECISRLAAGHAAAGAAVGGHSPVRGFARGVSPETPERGFASEGKNRRTATAWDLAPTFLCPTMTADRKTQGQPIFLQAPWSIERRARGGGGDSLFGSERWGRAKKC